MYRFIHSPYFALVSSLASTSHNVWTLSKGSFMQSTVDGQMSGCIWWARPKYTKVKLANPIIDEDQGVLKLSEGMYLYPQQAEFKFPNLFTNSIAILSEVISACYFSSGPLLNILGTF